LFQAEIPVPYLEVAAPVSKKLLGRNLGEFHHELPQSALLFYEFVQDIAIGSKSWPSTVATPHHKEKSIDMTMW